MTIARAKLSPTSTHATPSLLSRLFGMLAAIARANGTSQELPVSAHLRRDAGIDDDLTPAQSVTAAERDFALSLLRRP